MKFVLTIWLMLIFLPVVSCEIIKLYPKPGEYVKITFRKQECNIIHWKRNDTGAVLCLCALSGCPSYDSRYNCSNQDLNIKFDLSEDTFVIKAECDDATEYYTFCKPSPADTKNGQFDEPKTVVMGIVGGVISAFTVIIIAAIGYFHYRKRRNVDAKSGQYDEPKTVAVLMVVVFSVIAVIITVIGCLVYRKRRNDCVKNRANNDHDEEQKTLAVTETSKG